MTNADKIRNMTDEELSENLNCMQSNAYYCGAWHRAIGITANGNGYPANYVEWLEWLKQEAKQ